MVYPNLIGIPEFGIDPEDFSCLAGSIFIIHEDIVVDSEGLGRITINFPWFEQPLLSSIRHIALRAGLRCLLCRSSRQMIHWSGERCLYSGLTRQRFHGRFGSRDEGL